MSDVDDALVGLREWVGDSHMCVGYKCDRCKILTHLETVEREIARLRAALETEEKSHARTHRIGLKLQDRVESKPCETCGGSGKLRYRSLEGFCPDCKLGSIDHKWVEPEGGDNGCQ
jgi:hypothetical protein